MLSRIWQRSSKQNVSIINAFHTSSKCNRKVDTGEEFFLDEEDTNDSAEMDAGGESSQVKVATTANVNILKDGKDPEFKDDSEYPEWIHTILQPMPTFAALERKDDQRSFEDTARFLKLFNRNRIKQNNVLKSKKK